MKRKVAIEKLWGLVNRIDSHDKVWIAEKFIRECELSNEEFDDLMMAVAAQSRFLYELDRDAMLKPQYRRYAH